jgi:hypothetical protein
MLRKLISAACIIAYRGRLIFTILIHGSDIRAYSQKIPTKKGRAGFARSGELTLTQSNNPPSHYITHSR